LFDDTFIYFETPSFFQLDMRSLLFVYLRALDLLQGITRLCGYNSSILAQQPSWLIASK